MIAIRLDTQINPNILLKKIEQEIMQHLKSHKAEDSILYIDIKSISDTSDILIQRLGHALSQLDDN